MSKSYKIAAVVVMYNYDDRIINNIESYINQVDNIFVYDNSEAQNEDLAKKVNALPRISYYYNNDNLGIGKVLNMGAQKAVGEGFEYILTMDQDSRATPGMVRKLLVETQKKDLSPIGIISPFHTNLRDHAPKNKSTQEVMSVMTSGNLLNLQAFQEAGPFKEDFFMDYIDHEYCLRLNSKGFKVLRVNRAILKHQLGEGTSRRFFFKRLLTTNHSALRQYYITRNRLFVAKEYRKKFRSHCYQDLRSFFFSILKIIFFEKYKAKKLSMILRGIKDYRRGKLGKYV